MIVMNVIGGLGNQMFQYAAGRSLSKRLGVPLVLDLRAFDTYNLHGYRLDRLRLAKDVVQTRELSTWPRSWVRLRRKLDAFEVRWGGFYVEPSLLFDPGFEAITRGSYVIGYFQNERYFLNVADDVRSELTPRAALDDHNRAAHDAIRAEGPPTVAIHVRRGDYVTHPTTASIHGVMDAPYYAAALAEMRSRLGEIRCVVFSNDLPWAREYLPVAPDTLFIGGNGDRPEIDLALMSACSHQIIANSTFSWWAAWLNGNPQKIVVAPRRWFADGTPRDTALVPTSWLRV